jgi:Phage integrase family
MEKFAVRSSHFSSLARHSGRVQENWLVRAAKKLGNGRIGWHTFRHSHSTLLRPLGVDLKVQRELLQHADIRATMNIYTRAVRSALREANSKVVQLVISAQGDRGRQGSSVNAPSSSLGFFQVQENQEDIGRGGGDRKDKLLNKVCALNALNPPPLSNWNKRNKRQAQPPQVCRAADAESQQQLSV